jgi:hypothetical protein
MREQHWLLLVRIPASTLLVLAVAWLALPTVARAECGDYVVIDGKLTAARHPSAPLAAIPKPNSQKLPALPCNGPMCSKGSLPAPLPVAPVSSPTQDSACLNPTDIASDKDEEVIMGEDGPEQPWRLLSGVFRPPR